MNILINYLRIIHFIVAVTLFFYAVPARATEYHVDARTDEGRFKIAGPGPAPFFTIQASIGFLKPGDKLYIHKGTYAENIIINKSGSAGNPIIITPYSSSKPKILGKLTIFGDHVRVRGMMLSGEITVVGDYVRLEGFTIDDQVQTDGLRADRLNKASMSTLQGAIVIQGTNAEIIGMTIKDKDGVAISAGSGSTIKDNIIIGCEAGIHTASNTLVENNDISRLVQQGSGDCDYMRVFGTNVTVRGNYFHGTSQSETGDSHVDCFQTYDDNRQVASDVLIENNICVDWFHQGVMMENDKYPEIPLIKDWTVRNNIFQGYTAWGMAVGKSLNGGIRGVYIYNNLFAPAEGSGANGVGFTGKNSFGELYNNIFYNTGSSSYFTASEGKVTAGSNVIFNSPLPSGAGITSTKDYIGWDPSFVNKASQDYQLNSNSPLINAGYIVDVPKDLLGVVRPQGSRIDIGPYEFVGTPMAADPIFNYKGGIFEEKVSVELSISTHLAFVSYTTDGTTPTSTSTRYLSPINLTKTTTIKAMGFRLAGSYINSPVVSYTFTIVPDNTPPLLRKVAFAPDPTKLTIYFTEPIQAGAAAIEGNYTITGASVTKSVPSGDGNSVTLTTSTLSSGTNYTVSIANVKDQSKNANTISDVPFTFTYKAPTNLQDNFDGPGLNWQPTIPSRWAKSAGKYIITTSTYSTIGQLLGASTILPDVTFKEFDLSVDIIHPAPATEAYADATIVLGYVDPSNYYYMMFNRYGGFSILYGVAGNARTATYSLSKSYFTELKFHTFRVVYSDGTFTVYYDGKIEGSFEIDIPAGKVGLGSFNDAPQFDNFMVSSLEGAEVPTSIKPEPIIINSPGISIAYPNPMYGKVQFLIPDDAPLRALTIFDRAGQVVQFFNRDRIPNSTSGRGKGLNLKISIWDGTGNKGKQVESGIYFYEIVTDLNLYSGKITLIK